MTQNINRNKLVDDVIRFKQRLGMFLCAIYALVYAGFVAIAVYDVTLMDILMPFELNLATFYGVGLIIFALILSTLYTIACTLCERGVSSEATDKGSEI